MNKRRFIERLNLYLDEELSKEETEKLFLSIRRNPEYHRIYMQYCQIHSACSLIGEQFVEEPSKSNLRQKIYAVAGMAAAVALLGLAARNLSPILDAGDAAEGFVHSPSLKVNSSGTESLLVLDVNALEGARLSVNSFEVASFNIEDDFDVVEDPFQATRGIEFARFTVQQPEEKVQTALKKDFSFSQAVSSSTFAHEMVVAGETTNAAFSRSYPANITEGADEVRFDFGKVASFSNSLETSRVGAAKER